jgi:hypothetical protein
MLMDLDGVGAGGPEQRHQQRHAERDQVEGSALLDFGECATTVLPEVQQ